MFRITALLLFASLPLWSQAQEAPEVQPNRPHIFSIDAGGGLAFPFTDVGAAKAGFVFAAGAQYLAQPWLGVHLDLQYGKLQAGDAADASVFHMEFSNRFAYAVGTLRFYPLRLALSKGSDAEVRKNIKYLGGLYAGTGAGVMIGKAKAAPAVAPESGFITDPGGAQIAIPLEAGYSLPLAQLDRRHAGKVYGKSQLALTVNYRHNLSFSEKVDGYNPSVSSNKSKDAFSTLTIGLSYNL